MAMYKIHKSSVKTIRANDPKFLITDGYITTPRAAFEIDNRCPYEYRMVIDECLRNGWLRSVANITERELLFIGLNKDKK